MSANHDEHVHRLHTNDLEMGATEATAQHTQRHVVEPPVISQSRLNFEARRPRWLRECFAEALGVFFYCYGGIAPTASFLLNGANAGFSSIFQIGVGYALGIAFAIIVAAPTSGGHFHPAITLCFAIFSGFPWRKVPRYIISQIFGAFMAGMIIMLQYRVQIVEFQTKVKAAGLPLVSSTGPAAIFTTFPTPNETNQGYLFATEFFVDTYIGFVIWACLDPANPFMTPNVAPFAIGFAYAVNVWGFAPISIATNTARDLGTRLMCACFYGRECFTYKDTSWIYILTNIPATILAVSIYELVFRDNTRRLLGGHAKHEDGEDALVKHLSQAETAPRNFTK